MSFKKMWVCEDCNNKQFSYLSPSVCENPSCPSNKKYDFIDALKRWRGLGLLNSDDTLCLRTGIDKLIADAGEGGVVVALDKQWVDDFMLRYHSYSNHLVWVKELHAKIKAAREGK